MIVYCCADLIFASKVRATAESLGLPNRPSRDAEALAKRLARVEDGKTNLPVTGVVVDLDLGEPGIALIEQVKQHDTGIPVVAFGSHVATELLHAARDRGADFVMPRSQFTSNLPAILQRLSGASEDESSEASSDQL